MSSQADVMSYAADRLRSETECNFIKTAIGGAWTSLWQSQIDCMERRLGL